MIVKAQTGQMVADVDSIRVVKRMDKFDPERVFRYDVVGTLRNGEFLTLGIFKDKDSADNYFNDLADNQ